MRLKNRLATSLGLCVCLVGGLLIGRSSRAVAQIEPPATPSSIEQLFRDRYEVADHAYALAMIGHQQGQELGNDAMNWLRLRANARRGLREGKAERIAFIKEYLRELQNHEAFEERLKQQSLVDADTVLFARYERLDAEIWLAQEEQN